MYNSAKCFYMNEFFMQGYKVITVRAVDMDAAINAPVYYSVDQGNNFTQYLFPTISLFALIVIIYCRCCYQN